MQCGTGRFRRVNISCDEFSTDFDLVNIFPESGGCKISPNTKSYLNWGQWETYCEPETQYYNVRSILPTPD